MFKKLLRNYVSPIDRFLSKFNKDHKPSPSQQAEIDKYQNIMKLRDNASDEARVSKPGNADKIWNEF